MHDLSSAIRRHTPHVVGSAGHRTVLQSTPDASQCDLVELRLDTLGTDEEVRAFAEKIKGSVPLLITARHPDEGGSNDLSARARTEALMSGLEHASAMDLELRSLPEMDEVWEAAKVRGVIRVCSWHDFEHCPCPAEFSDRISAMKAAGADVAKIAVRLHSPQELAVLGEALENKPLPLALMGMGPLAPASRLLAAQLGSVLNYGYLGGEATAPGQWPAAFLKAALSHSAEV